MTRTISTLIVSKFGGNYISFRTRTVPETRQRTDKESIFSGATIQQQHENKNGMKKTIIPGQTKPTQRTTAARRASVFVCFALLGLGAKAFAAPPANDNFAAATAISGSLPIAITGINAGASLESGEPNHSPSEPAGTNSVWWTWTPSSSAPVTIDTGGSTSDVDNDGLDTQLAVYTGSSLSGLTLVANNEDSTTFSGGRSLVTFNAAAGTTYHIAVSGFNNEPGTVHLNITSGTTTVTGLTLTVTTTGSGTVTKTPSKATYDTNEVVTVVAAPIGTNTFLGWAGTDEASTNLTNTVTMTASKTITANFTGSGGGGGNCGDLTSTTVLTRPYGLTKGLRGRLDPVERGWPGVSQAGPECERPVVETINHPSQQKGNKHP